MAPGIRDSQRWRVLEDLFQAACDLPPAERPEFLDHACCGDSSLRLEVEALLASADHTSGFIQQPVLDAARTVSQSFVSCGKRVGPYEVCTLIGVGGMSHVYLGRRADQAYSQNVALKFMHTGFGRDSEMLVRFRVERQILANLNHPNVARLFDGGVTPEGLPWLALEYVEGVPIDEYCRGRSLSLRHRLELFLTVCAAIEYAHRNLVIHRDIKSANVLVTSEGVPKLLDFGIAKLLAPEFADSVRTRASERLMTPEYASPEQVRGEPVTTATDVYSLGVLLYELLAGRRPFRVKTANPLEMAQAICEETPPSPSATCASDPSAGLDPRRLKGDLDTIVLMAIRKEPERRYSSVAQLSADVRAYLGGYPLVARGDSWGYRAGTFIKRHKAAVASAVVVAIALAGFAIGMRMLAQKAGRERETAQREAQFLAGMFRATSPATAHGQAITARTLLDQGAARINHELSGAPQLRASLLQVIAEAYRSLGLFKESQTSAQQAFELVRSSLGADSPEAAKSQELLAELQRDQGHYAEAEALLRQLIASKQKTRQAQSPETANLMAELGECLWWEAKDDEAIDLLRRTLAIDRKNGPDYGSATRNYLALTLERKGDIEEAQQLLEEAVEISRRTLGSDSPSYIHTLHNLGSSFVNRGDLYGAEARLREALAIRRRVLGPDHPDLRYSLSSLSSVLLRRGEWRAAEPYVKENLDLAVKTLGSEHPQLAAPMVYGGLLLQAKRDYKGAREMFTRIAEILKKANSGNTWPAAVITSSLAWLDFDQGNYAAAEEEARSAMDLLRKLGGENTPEFAASLVQVAEVRLYEGDVRSAEPLLRQALEIRRKRLSAGHPDISASEVRLGEALLADKAPEQAEPLLKQAVHSLTHPPFRVPAWQVAEAKAAYGVCLQALGRTAEGAALLDQSRPDLALDPRPVLRTDPTARLRLLQSP
jgi:serine/threonine-protein kinase